MIYQYDNQLPSVEAWNRSAGRRGGDFIVRHESDDRIGLFVGDATGHGEAAFDVTEYIKPIISREIVLGLRGSLIQRWHRLVRARFEAEHRFVCFTALQLDVRSQILTIYNGGNPEVVIRRGEQARLERYSSTGMPLGLVDDFEWIMPRPQCVKFQPSDYAICFTDGVPDCPDAFGRHFGLRRVIASLRVASERTALQMLRRRLLQYSPGSVERDDLSIAVMHGKRRQVA